MLNFIGFIWVAQLCSGMVEMTLAGTFGTWYWASPKANVPAFTLTSTAVRTLRYHFGSLALGALVITVTRAARAMLDVYATPFKWLKYGCTYFAGNVRRRFNRNAYIMCAVHGRRLWISQYKAHQLMQRHAPECVTNDDTLCGLVFLMCRIFLAIASGTGGFVYYRHYYTLLIVFPISALVFGTFFVTGIFLNVYSVAVDTLMLCARE